MLVVGFDPGSLSFGLGILKKEGNKISYVFSEEIKLKHKDFYTRMKHLWEKLDRLFAAYPIDRAALEEGYLGKNVKTMNVLAQVRGLVLAAAVHHGTEMTFYSPREVKMTLTGYGSAMKSQVAKMVKKLLQLENKNLGSDESDALAVAYCHIVHLKSRLRVGTS